MKRIILMLTVAAMLVVAMTVSAAPAFAAVSYDDTSANGQGDCQAKTGNGGGSGTYKDSAKGNCNAGKVSFPH